MVSLDIKGAFLQGLKFTELAELARSLGYEHRHQRDVFVIPPENVWRHFREILKDPRHHLYVEDKYRAAWFLLCLSGMYGFADAPLLFQMALVFYLVQQTAAIKSAYDDNHLFWFFETDHGTQCFMMMTVHVDDLQVIGARRYLIWIHAQLETRFGEIKWQELPYTHTGIELELVSPDCLLQHQEQFASKLEMHTFSSPARRWQLEDACDAVETTSFRSIVCACLWACITRQDVMSQVTALQRSPTD